MKKKNVFALISLTFMLSSYARAAEVKIGVYDMQEVVDNIEDGKKAKADFQKMFDARKKEFEAKEKDLAKLAESLERQKLVIKPELYEDKRKELQMKGNEFMQQKSAAEIELQKKDVELRGKLFTKVRSVVEKLGREGTYTVVLEKSEGGVIYFPASIDLTAKIVQEYNKAYPKI